MGSHHCNSGVSRCCVPFPATAPVFETHAAVSVWLYLSAQTLRLRSVSCKMLSLASSDTETDPLPPSLLQENRKMEQRNGTNAWVPSEYAEGSYLQLIDFLGLIPLCTVDYNKTTFFLHSCQLSGLQSSSHCCLGCHYCFLQELVLFLKFPCNEISACFALLPLDHTPGFSYRLREGDMHLFLNIPEPNQDVENCLALRAKHFSHLQFCVNKLFFFLWLTQVLQCGFIPTAVRQNISACHLISSIELQC